MKYAIEIGHFGTLKLRETNNYNLKFEQSIAPGAEPTDRMGGIDHPKWSNTLRAAFEFAGKEVSPTARSYAGTKNIDAPAKSQDAAITNARIGSCTVWDTNFATKPIKNLDVTFGINNLFDKGIVYLNSVYKDTYVNAMNDLVGRYFYLNARYKFK